MDGEIFRIVCAVLLTLFIAVAPAKGESKFSHVLIIVQENRSPDNLFGSHPDFEPGVGWRGQGASYREGRLPGRTQSAVSLRK